MKKFGEKIEGVEYKRRPGSYGVIIKNGQAGVVKASGYDTYFLTGGGIDEGEDERRALRREAAEEIGFRIKIGEKIGEAIEYFYSKAEEKYIAKECHFYRMSLAEETEESGKHELVWIKQDEINKMHHKSYEWIIQQELIADKKLR
jgi:8-oxo-dGTP diphosphatase